MTLPYYDGGKSVEWETPEELFDKLDAEFHFTLDVCATPKNTKCLLYYTPQLDGLKQRWAPNTCWMNPPYGREISKWVAKAYEEAQRGATVVCLLPARTDTAWWHDYAIKGEVRFLRGRVKFVGSPNSAPFPSAVVIFRGKLKDGSNEEQDVGRPVFLHSNGLPHRWSYWRIYDVPASYDEGQG